VNLGPGGPLLSDLEGAVENVQAGIRVGVRDQNGGIYRIDNALYDTARMAVVFQIDTTKPIALPNV
jgi:hypothetical protein